MNDPSPRLNTQTIHHSDLHKFNTTCDKSALYLRCLAQGVSTSRMAQVGALRVLTACVREDSCVRASASVECSCVRNIHSRAEPMLLTSHSHSNVKLPVNGTVSLTRLNGFLVYTMLKTRRSLGMRVATCMIQLD